MLYKYKHYIGPMKNIIKVSKTKIEIQDDYMFWKKMGHRYKAEWLYCCFCILINIGGLSRCSQGQIKTWVVTC